MLKVPILRPLSGQYCSPERILDPLHEGIFIGLFICEHAIMIVIRAASDSRAGKTTLEGRMKANEKVKPAFDLKAFLAKTGSKRTTAVTKMADHFLAR